MNTYHNVMGVTVLLIGLAVPAFADTTPGTKSPAEFGTPTPTTIATSTPAPTAEPTWTPWPTWEPTPTEIPTPAPTATKTPFNPEPWPEYSDGLPNCEPGPDGRALVEPCGGKG